MVKKFTLVFISSICILFAAEGALRLGGWVIGKVQESHNEQALVARRDIRILTLGESTTAMVATPEGTWPWELEQILNAKNVDKTFTVINKGVIGTNSTAIAAHIPQYLKIYRPHIVVAMMGINDYNTYYATPEGDLFDLVPADARWFRGLKLYKLFVLARIEMVKLVRNKKLAGVLGVADTSLDAETLEKRLTLAIQTHPTDVFSHIDLGILYRNGKRYEESEKMLQQAIALRPSFDWPYIELGKTYRDKGRFDDARQALSKAVSVNPKSALGYHELEILARIEGNTEEAQRMAEQVLAINGTLVENYRAIAALCEKEGVEFISVQYPMRNADLLRTIVRNEVPVVDNEKNFHDAVAESSYEEYFTDRFAGDFGHLTRKGNMLLATYIARMILNRL